MIEDGLDGGNNKHKTCSLAKFQRIPGNESPSQRLNILAIDPKTNQTHAKCPHQPLPYPLTANFRSPWRPHSFSLLLELAQTFTLCVHCHNPDIQIPGHSSYFKMMSSPSHGTQTPQTRVTFSKEILVRGDLTEDVNDIVEKFIKVAHGPEALGNNRARENARENIRKKLAMEAGREKQDSCDLQVNNKLLFYCCQLSNN